MRRLLNYPWYLMLKLYAHIRGWKDTTGYNKTINTSPYATKQSTKGIIERIEFLTTGDTIHYVQIQKKVKHRLRILHLSDLHFPRKDVQKVRAMHDRLSAEEFDIVVFTGDVLHHNHDTMEPEQKKFLKDINGKHGKYYVYGDHDGWGKSSHKRIASLMQQLGYTVLDNTMQRIWIGRQPIALIGFDDIRRGTPKYDIMKQVKKNDFNIALMHNLDTLNADVPDVLDLALWGHLHAGEINLFLFDGFAFMEAALNYLNINKHRCTKVGAQYLTERTISYANPGFYSYFKDTWGIPRLNTRPQGVAIIEIHP